jgi:hypothetical protein
VIIDEEFCAMALDHTALLQFQIIIVAGTLHILSGDVHIYKSSPRLQQARPISITKVNLLMRFREIIAVYSGYCPTYK